MAGEELLGKAIALLRYVNANTETTAWFDSRAALFAAYDAHRQRAGDVDHETWLRVLKAYTDLCVKIEARMKSGNSVPCERFHITADEWAVIDTYDSAVEHYMTSMSWEIGILRMALIRAGNATEGRVSDECSSEFLSHVGEEVELFIAGLRKKLTDPATVRVPREPSANLLRALAVALEIPPIDEDDYPITGKQSTVRQYYDAMLSAAEAER